MLQIVIKYLIFSDTKITTGNLNTSKAGLFHDLSTYQGIATAQSCPPARHTQVGNNYQDNQNNEIGRNSETSINYFLSRHICPKIYKEGTSIDHNNQY